jgi:hypothetical protein
MALASACSSSSSSGGGGGGALIADSGGVGISDGGGDASTTPMQEGTIVEFTNPGVGVPMAVIATALASTDGGAGPSATADANGVYSLAVPLNAPFSMHITATGHYDLWEQQTTLLTSADRGKTSLLDMGTGSMLQGLLTGYDSTLGVLSVAVIKTGACASAGGATVTLSAPGVDGGTVGAMTTAYFSGGIPSASQTSTVDGQFPSSVSWNLPIGVPITATLSALPTGCTLSAFPVSYADPSSSTPSSPIQYDNATVQVYAGNATSFLRLFVQ